MTNLTTLFILAFICLIFNFLLNYVQKKSKKTQLHKIFVAICILFIFWLINLMLQIILVQKANISPLFFDYFIYIAICFMPVLIFILSQIFAKTKIRFTAKYLMLFIIPTLSLIMLWTNNYHHLFYKVYSINMNETQFGMYFYVHTIYTYILYIISLMYLVIYSVKNSGFFSKQASLVVVGSIVPIVVNLLGIFGIIPMNIYLTPISFTVAILFFALAIFKFDFLKVAPIALQRIVDRISDSYLVIDEDNKVIDFNKTFLDTFKVSANNIRNKNLFEINDMNSNSFKKVLEEIEKTGKTIVVQKHFDSIDKYFNIEINSITNKGSFLGTLILLKDVTQHNKDMQTIKDNQDMLVEKERLASLGQMIGGIAHNLKTPIMSIAGASEGLSDLIKEYDESIGDPEVTNEDHHEIAKDMNEWIEKIRTHLSYMSDIITAIKGQAVAFSEQTASEFTIKELINYVDILMKHELKNALINLNLQIEIDDSTTVKGNINSLVQVINNIISNSIQAYQSKRKTNEDIDFRIYKEGNYIVFKISDMAGGLPEKVQDRLFKEMITTKGKNGTGLGLFMSYSNIRAHFSGNLRYETEKGKGTSFYIEIPM